MLKRGGYPEHHLPRRLGTPPSDSADVLCLDDLVHQDGVPQRLDPGRCRDYLEMSNFDFDIKIDSENTKRFEVQVNAAFAEGGVH
jgi:hypothetical protein